MLSKRSVLREDLSRRVHQNTRKTANVMAEKKKKKKKKEENTKEDEHIVVISSYTTFRADHELLHSAVGGCDQWYYSVLDEGHLIKNIRTSTYAAVTTLSNARHRIVLTGTPIQNDVFEIWPLFHYLIPFHLGTKNEFDRKYVHFFFSDFFF